MAEIRPGERDAIAPFLERHNALRAARLGRLEDTLAHPSFMAVQDDRVVGVATYVPDGESCELLTLHADPPRHGVGTALIEAVAAGTRCARLWLITTNDNVDALRFYQRRGFVLSRLRAGAVDRARATLKPAIPETGAHGIPLRDELELELRLGDSLMASPVTDAATLLALELALARRDEAAIPGGYEAILATDFAEIGASGRLWTRAETLEALHAEPPNDAITIESFELAGLVPDVVLATYDAVGMDPDGVVIRRRRSSTWIRRDDRWQLRFHQGTPVPDDG